MRRTPFFALCFAFALTASLSADNLVQNRGFATDLSHWTVYDYTTGVWSPKDHGGGGSGSAQLTSTALPGFSPLASIEQCVAVTAGHVYVGGASLWLPGDVAPTAQVSAGFSVRFFGGPSCSGNQIDSFITLADPVVRDTWIDVQKHGTAPPGSVSASAGFFAIDYTASSTTETVQAHVDDAYFLTDTSCAGTQSHLCLNNGRFRMFGAWRVPSQDRSGYMRAVPVTSDSGLFWFFSSDNLEIFAKVLNACADPYNHYWVFASGLTNVETTLQVVDTVSGATWDNFNVSGTAFPPVLDTSAFATCP